MTLKNEEILIAFEMKRRGLSTTEIALAMNHSFPCIRSMFHRQMLVSVPSGWNSKTIEEKTDQVLSGYYPSDVTSKKAMR